MHFARTILAAIVALIWFFLASALALATEPEFIENVDDVVVTLPPCEGESILDVRVVLIDTSPEVPSPDAAALQEEVDGKWTTVMSGDFFDEVAGNSGVVYLHRHFDEDETALMRVIVYPHEGKEVVVRGPETVALDCTDDPAPTPTETAAPTQGATEEASPTPTTTETTTPPVKGPVVETDILPEDPSDPNWIWSGILLMLGATIGFAASRYGRRRNKHRDH